MPFIGKNASDFGFGSHEGRVRRDGVFLGIVKETRDAQRMGRVKVYIPELGGDPTVESNWYVMSYASPFAGASTVDDNASSGEDVKKMKGTQKSYGWWSVPPDLENEVLCCFVNGDTARGYWFACVYQQFMNHMVPGIGLNLSTNDEINKLNLPPVCEYNKKDKEVTAVWKPKRPVYEPLHNGLVAQGLYTDPERGPSTSGARREAPSKVFGLLTPRGNNIHIDEDPENEFIRLRTRSGVQIVVHETTGYIYMISKAGDSWFEISDEGIDMYSKRSISMRAEENINIHADQSVIMHGAGSIHQQSTNHTTKTAGAHTTKAAGETTRNAPTIKDNSKTKGTETPSPGNGTGGGGETGAATPTTTAGGANSGGGTGYTPASGASPQRLPRTFGAPISSAASTSASSAAGGGTNQFGSIAGSYVGQTAYQNAGSLNSFISQNAGVNYNVSNGNWCGVFTAAVLGSEGIDTSGISVANSQAWRNFGSATDTPAIGDVAVWNEGRHVGVVTGFADNGNPIILSGNYSKSVAYTSGDSADKFEFRRPTDQSDKSSNQGATSGGLGQDQASDTPSRSGSGQGNTDTKESNETVSKSKQPLSATDKQDIKGTGENYKQTTTKSSVTRLPTHEPWAGHPQSMKAARKGLSDAGNNSSGESRAPTGEADRNVTSGGAGGGGGGGGRGSGVGSNDDARDGPVTPYAGKAQFNEMAPRIIADLKKDFGLTDAQAIGIVANLGHESGGFRYMQELRPIGRGRGGYGWAQWTGPRRRQFESYAAARGLSVNSYEANYGFLRHELRTSESKSLSAVRSASTVFDATQKFERAFERAGIINMGSRMKWAATAQKALENSKSQKKENPIETADDGNNKKAEAKKPGGDADKNTTPPPGTEKGGKSGSGSGSGSGKSGDSKGSGGSGGSEDGGSSGKGGSEGGNSASSGSGGRGGSGSGAGKSGGDGSVSGGSSAGGNGVGSAGNGDIALDTIDVTKK